MTGRDLIIYILENNLENELVFNEEGRFIGFITVGEIAAKYNVGTATVLAWLNETSLTGFVLDGNIYVPATFEPPVKQTKE